MNREQKEAWRLGIQEGYSEGYDDGYEKGFEEGKRRGRGWIEFLKIRCTCGYVIPYPIFRNGFSIEFRFPNDEARHCPNCKTRVPKDTVLKAYSDHKRYQH